MGAALSPRFGKGFSYADCWVDDASLVVLNAMDTRERGAQIRTRTRFVSARRAGAVWSAEIDGPQGARQTVQASMLVNAAGPWVVLANFEQILSDPAFWRALTNNLWFALGTIPVSIALALLMPIWVNGRMPGRTFARMAYFTPTILPMIAAANIWLFFFTPPYGLIEQIASARLEKRVHYQ